MLLRVSTSLLVSLTIFLGSEAFACSCAPPRGVDASVREASVVVLAEVVSSEQHPTAANASTITEEVTFRVLETFKGTSKRGDLLRTRSTLGPAGPCGVSVKNSPVWLESLVNGKPIPTKLSGRWVLYGGQSQPFELNMCGPSIAMEAGGGGALRQLRGLAKRAHSKR